MCQRNYFIRVSEELIEVNEEIYLCYYRAKRRMRYYEQDIKCGKPIHDAAGDVIGYTPSKEDSLERLLENGVIFISDELVEDTVCHRFQSDKLYKALASLTDDERKLIEALYLSGGKKKREREYSRKTGIPQKTINYRKQQVLKKLKNILEK